MSALIIESMIIVYNMEICIDIYALSFDWKIETLKENLTGNHPLLTKYQPPTREREKGGE